MSKDIRFLVCEYGAMSGEIIVADSHQKAAQEYFGMKDPVLSKVCVYQLADDIGMTYEREVKVRHVKR